MSSRHVQVSPFMQSVTLITSNLKTSIWYIICVKSKNVNVIYKF
jgi:hypothetical protein